MPCRDYAHVCKTCTTNSRKDDHHAHALPRTRGDYWDFLVCPTRRRDRDVAVELAHTVLVRLAHDHILAGIRSAGVGTPAIRRARDAQRRRPACWLEVPRTPRRSCGRPRGGSYREDDAGGKGALSSAPARARLRYRRRGVSGSAAFLS